jgi:hypothetical protein
MQQSWSGGRALGKKLLMVRCVVMRLVEGSVFEVLVLVWVEEVRWNGVEFDRR